MWQGKWLIKQRGGFEETEGREVAVKAINLGFDGNRHVIRRKSKICSKDLVASLVLSLESFILSLSISLSLSIVKKQAHQKEAAQIHTCIHFYSLGFVSVFHSELVAVAHEQWVMLMILLIMS